MKNDIINFFFDKSIMTILAYGNTVGRAERYQDKNGKFYWLIVSKKYHRDGSSFSNDGMVRTRGEAIERLKEAKKRYIELVEWDNKNPK